jgi:hypothetical protein
MSVQPTFEEFRSLARDHRTIPVWRSLLADQVTPVAIFARCVGEDDGFLLESVENGERWSRWSFLGRNPLATVVSTNGEISITGPLADQMPTGNGMLATLEALLETFSAPSLEGLPPLHSGLMGYIGYDVVREVEHLPNVPADDTGHADGVMAMIGELVAFDHWRQQVTLIANTVVPEHADEATLRRCYDDACQRVITLQNDGARPLDSHNVSISISTRSRSMSTASFVRSTRARTCISFASGSSASSGPLLSRWFSFSTARSSLGQSREPVPAVRPTKRTDVSAPNFKNIQKKWPNMSCWSISPETTSGG